MASPARSRSRSLSSKSLVSVDSLPGFDLPRLERLINRQLALLEEEAGLPLDRKMQPPLNEEKEKMQEIMDTLFEWMDATWYHAVERNSSHVFWHRYLKFCWLTLRKLFASEAAGGFHRMTWEHRGIFDSRSKLVFRLPLTEHPDDADRGVMAPYLVLFLWKEILLRLYARGGNTALADTLVEEIREMVAEPFELPEGKLWYTTGVLLVLRLSM